MPTPPLAAALTAFLLAALPALVLMGVWTAVTVFRIVFPERGLPFLSENLRFDPAARREAARAKGQTVPVGYRDIADDVRRQARTAQPAGPDAEGAPLTPRTRHPLYDDLWTRRN